MHLLLIMYPTDTAADSALAHFQKIYLPGSSSAREDRGVASVEDGWVGYVLSGCGLGLVFEAPDEESTRHFLETMKQALDNQEASND